MKLTRRKDALKRLESQLASGIKPITDLTIMRSGNIISNTEPLTDYDIKRIKKEIALLKERM